MPHRPLVFVSGLTLGDYLLWNWSLNSNHDVLALVSGLTLPPLAVACLWLLVLSAARLIALITRRPGARGTATGRARKPNTAGPPLEEPAPAPAAGRSSGKLAA
ncbi:MAG TPA: hypothetical protein VES97_04240 [Solirubrobacteraceae bacterium]|nr:hypothetical protein [Solirubrobacteraceae bacterium]